MYSNHSSIRFAEIRKFYPEISNVGETRYWLKTHSDNFKDHPCKRECVANQSFTCYYYMIVHYDETMGPACAPYLDIKNRYKYKNREYVNPYKVREQSVGNFDDCKYMDGERTELKVVNGQLPGKSKDKFKNHFKVILYLFEKENG